MDLSSLDLTTIINSIPSPVISLAIGLAICFMGYRLRQAAIMLAGGLIGYLITYQVAPLILDENGTLIAAVVVALLLAAFCSWLYDAGVFVLCGGCAVLLVSSFLVQYSLQIWLQLAILAIVFAVAGILAVRLDQPVMIIITGFAGAGCTLSSLVRMGWNLPGAPLHIALLLILSVVGISIQFATTHD